MSVIDYPKKGEVYQHYKGGYYLVEGVARHSETGKPMVLYRNLYHKAPFPTDEPSPEDFGIPFGQLNVRPLTGQDGWSTPVKQEPGTVLSGVKRIVRFQRVEFAVWP